jgi:hypothetical protein
MVKYKVAAATLFLFVLFAVGAIGQIPNDYKYQEFKERFPKESFVNLEISSYDQFDLNENGLDITSEYFERFLCLNENAVRRKKRAVSYNNFNPILDIEAKMYYPQKGKYKTEKIKEFQDKAVIENGMSFYDNSREKSFSFDNIREGSVVELSLKRQSKDEYLVSSKTFYLGYYAESYIYKIKCNKDINMGFFMLNMEGSDIVNTEWEDDDYKYYQWELKDAEEHKFYGDYDYSDYFLPSVIPYIKSYTFEGKEVMVLDDTDGLYDWYKQLIAKVNAPTSPELKELAAQINADYSTEKEKVKATYQWVQDNIKYIAFSDGYGGFIPRDPDQVLQKRFGDCKDMSCLIINLLGEMDIEAHFTWVGTRHKPFTYTELPTPVVDNHMIATYIDDAGKHYILDATNSNLKFGRASYSIQGKQALIGLDSVDYEIYEVPILPASDNTGIEELALNIDGKSIKGQGTYLATGYHAQYIQDIYSGIDSDQKKKEFISGMLEKGSNKFKMTDYNYEWSPIMKDSLRISYAFEIDSYINQVGDDTYLNLNLSKDLKRLKLPDNRNVTSFFEFLFYFQSENTLILPEGTEVKSLPSTASVNNDLLQYEIAYRQEANKLIYTLTFTQKVIEVAVNDIELWNETVKQLSADLDKSIKLTKSDTDE